MAAFWACNELTLQNDCILRQDLKAVALARIYGRRDSAAISRGNCDRWQLWNLNKLWDPWYDFLTFHEIINCLYRVKNCIYSVVMCLYYVYVIRLCYWEIVWSRVESLQCSSPTALTMRKLHAEISDMPFSKRIFVIFQQMGYLCCFLLQTHTIRLMIQNVLRTYQK